MLNSYRPTRNQNKKNSLGKSFEQTLSVDKKNTWCRRSRDLWWSRRGGERVWKAGVENVRLFIKWSNDLSFWKEGAVKRPKWPTSQLEEGLEKKKKQRKKPSFALGMKLEPASFPDSVSTHWSPPYLHSPFDGIRLRENQHHRARSAVRWKKKCPSTHMCVVVFVYFFPCFSRLLTVWVF